jgi:hypothetical protein
MEAYLFNKVEEYLEKCLVLLYQLKVCNLKTALSVKGSKVIKSAFMAGGRKPVEAWTGTLDEVEFCPPTYPVIHIFYKKIGSV